MYKHNNFLRGSECIIFWEFDFYTKQRHLGFCFVESELGFIPHPQSDIYIGSGSYITHLC